MATDSDIFIQSEVARQNGGSGFVGKNQIQPVQNASIPAINPIINNNFSKQVNDASVSVANSNAIAASMASAGAASSSYNLAAANDLALKGMGSGDLTVAVTGNLGKGSETQPKGVTKEAAATATKTADASKHKTTSPGGGGDVTVNISEMAIASKLDANDILAIYTYLCGPGNINLLAAWVYLLYNANGAVGMTVSADVNSNKKDQPITISGNMLMYMHIRGNAVIKNKFHKGVLKAFKKTPAYKSKFFEDVGDIGVTMVSNSDRVAINPMTGSTKHTPSLIEQALNKIHPKFTEELEKYCNVLKGKLYLALPANILGSIQYAINYINGVVTAFAQMINEVYQGCLNAIKEFVAMIDAIMQPIMLWLLTLLDSIVPLDIICLILDILSLFIGDITMYTNLFSQSVKISDFLKTFNIGLGPVGDFLSDPVNTLSSFLPSNVRSVIDLVNSASNDPMGYLGGVLSNYGYGYMMNYLKGDIMGGVLNQFGSKAPILYPINGIMKKYGFNGKIELTDPNKPSPNIVLPAAITGLRDGIERTFDSFGDSLDATTGAISDSIFTVSGVDPNRVSTPLAGITRV